MRAPTRVNRVVLAFALAVAMATLAGCSPYFSSSRFGVNVVNVPWARTPTPAIAQMRAAGFKWARVFICWGCMQPNNGTDLDANELAASDRIINDLARRQFSILVTLTGGVPAWAKTTAPDGAVCSRDNTVGPPKDDQVFRSFVSAMVSRYKDRVGAWEFWNEPNGNCSFAGTPQMFRSRILKPGYETLKAIQPGATVLATAMGNLKPSNVLDSLDSFLTYTKNNTHYLVVPVDAFALHAYGTVSNIEAGMNKLSGYKRCTEDGHCTDRYWLTEFGFNEIGCWTWFGCQSTDPGADANTIFDFCAGQNDCDRALYWSAEYDDYDATGQLTSLGLLTPGSLVPRAKYNTIRNKITAADGVNPGELKWSYSGPIPGYHCVQLNEPADPHTWNDNYLCSLDDLGLQWSYSGPVPGMRCTAVNEPSDPDTWNDNYLCSPVDYGFAWSYSGPIPGRPCVQVNEPADPDTWNDNYLCSRTP